MQSWMGWVFLGGQALEFATQAARVLLALGTACGAVWPGMALMGQTGDGIARCDAGKGDLHETDSSGWTTKAKRPGALLHPGLGAEVVRV